MMRRLFARRSLPACQQGLACSSSSTTFLTYTHIGPGSQSLHTTMQLVGRPCCSCIMQFDFQATRKAPAIEVRNRTNEGPSPQSTTGNRVCPTPSSSSNKGGEESRTAYHIHEINFTRIIITCSYRPKDCQSDRQPPRGKKGV